MSDRIPLHPDRGLDPRLLYCPRCAKNTNGEIGVGHVRLGVTKSGKRIVFNRGAHKRAAPVDDPFVTITDLPEHEKVCGVSLCDPCKKEVAAFKEEVEERGGVHFLCQQCGVQGVVKGSAPAATETRDQVSKQTGADYLNRDPVTKKFRGCGLHVESCKQHAL